MNYLERRNIRGSYYVELFLSIFLREKGHGFLISFSSTYFSTICNFCQLESNVSEFHKKNLLEIFLAQNVDLTGFDNLDAISSYLTVIKQVSLTEKIA